MPTPSEKKAMLFLAVVAVLGISVRALRAVGSVPAVVPADSLALERQLAAVDSARAARHKGKGNAGSTAKHPARTRSRTAAARSGDSSGLTPLESRPPDLRASAAAGLPPWRRAVPLDLDVATEAQIESLPWVGPVLARRIVADREARGSFGTLANLRRVKGIGPALASRLDSMVTFSGTPRPSSAASPDSSVLPRTWRGRRPRPRPP